MAPKLAMYELLKRLTLLSSKLTRADADADVLAKPLIDLYSAKIEMDLLENLGVDIQSLEDTILVTCSADDFDDQQAELTAMVKRYTAIKLQLKKLTNPPSPAQIPQQPPFPDPNFLPLTPAPPQIKLPKIELPRCSAGCSNGCRFGTALKLLSMIRKCPGL